MKLSDMRRVLAEGRIQLTKSLGQNFLFDPNSLRRIAEAAAVTNKDAVLEIGPGLGPLTELLLDRARQVLAIEKDPRLFDWLKAHFAGAANLTLVQDDAVDYLQSEARDWSDWLVVSNLPYSATSALLTALALASRPPRRMTLTLQWEVARRLMANAGDADYGVLTLLVQLRFAPRDWFKVSRKCFYPEPEVDSAVLTLNRREQSELPLSLTAAFEQLVRVGFSQRRKMMMKLLRTHWPPARVEAAFRELGLPAAVRAEQVTLTQFVHLTRLLCLPND